MYRRQKPEQMHQRLEWRLDCQKARASQSRKQACWLQSLWSQTQVQRRQSLWIQRLACWRQKQALMQPQMLAASNAAQVKYCKLLTIYIPLCASRGSCPYRGISDRFERGHAIVLNMTDLGCTTKWV